MPFASSKGAATFLSTVLHEVKENNENIKNTDKEDEEILFSLKNNKNQQKIQKIRLLGFMAFPKEEVEDLQKRINYNFEIPSKNQKSLNLHSRPKRMHHLSILRKVGTPHGQLLLGGGNGRLFGPQKETRELKRTSPLFFVKY